MKKATIGATEDTWQNCTPDGQPPIVGTEYRINHRRKGQFTGVVRTADPTTWAEVEITEGCSHAIMPYNIRLTGETVSVRSTLCRMVPAEPASEQAGEVG